jgi:GT2 family glycosyltransferase
VRYLQTGSNLGYAGGNNRGFAAALDLGADYVLVLNDDTVVDRDCVQALVDAARETDSAVTAPLIVYYDRPDLVWYGGGVLSRARALGIHVGENEPIDPAQQRAPTSFVCGCCFLIRADALRAVGGFNETFFAYAEDVELSLRLAEAGYRMTYEPKARVLHRIAPSAAPSAFQIRQRDRNRRRIAALHYGALERARFASWFYPTRLAHLTRYLLTGNIECARAIIAGAFGSIA